MAQIEIILGSMFSGKSTELARRCRTYSAIGQHVQMINHSFDTRCSENQTKTHDNLTMKATKTKNLLELDIDSKVDVIAIDEAQFFDDLYDFVQIHERKELVIIIAGLDGDFNREIFGEIYKCIPLCNSITKLSAMCSICRNGNAGCFSKRNAKGDEQVLIGAKAEYSAVCRKHFFTPSSDCCTSGT